MPVAIPLAAAGSFLGSSAGLAAATIGTGIAGAAISGNAAKNAAKTQAAAADRATATQLQMYGQTREDLSPYRSLGGTASSAYARLLGLNDNAPGATGQPDWTSYLRQNPDVAARAQQGIQEGVIGEGRQWRTPEEWAATHYQNTGQSEGRQVPVYAAPSPGAIDPRQAALEATPGYQFTRDQGVASISRALGTKGLTGAQAKGIGRFVTGLADQTYGDNVTRLQNATTIGANAAAQTGSIGATTGANVANTITGAGQAIASGQVGMANAITQGLSSIPGALLTNKILGGGGGIYGAKTTSTSNLKAA